MNSPTVAERSLEDSEIKKNGICNKMLTISDSTEENPSISKVPALLQNHQQLTSAIILQKAVNCTFNIILSENTKVKNVIKWRTKHKQNIENHNKY